MSTKELAAWLVSECEKRNLSWAEASRRAMRSLRRAHGPPLGNERERTLPAMFAPRI